MIDLSALRYNYKKLKKLAGGIPAIAVVKADAYGHGAVEVSRALEEEGADFLAVAYLSEAKALRQAGIKTEIIVLFDEGEGEVHAFAELALTPVLHSPEAALAFSAEGMKRGRPVNVHVKVDTGMGRMGMPLESAEQEILKMAGLPGIRITGLMSHFSEVNPDDLSYARLQLARFRGLRESLSREGIRPLCHMSSSASTLLMPESHLDCLRIGLLLYGSLPFGASGPGWDFRPVMKVKSRVMGLKKLRKGEPVSYDRTFIAPRDSVIAAVPVGYADGYMRAFSNRAEMLVRGRRAPVAGRVCMDLTLLDVTDVMDVSKGDEVVLLGDGLSHLELAARAGTNPYEIMTSLGRGARRSYYSA